MLRDLFAEGAFSAAFVPSFVQTRQESEEEAKKLFWNLFFVLGSVTFSIGLLTFIFAPQIVNLVAPEFQSDPDKLEVTINLTKMMSPYLMFISLAALFMGALNAMKVFFLPSIAPAFFNAAMIISMVVFPSVLKGQGVHPIYSLGIGVFLGGIIQAFVQFPLLMKAGYQIRFPKNVLSTKVKEVIAKLGPGMIGFAATQINLIVNTILATSTVIGAVSWLSYAFRLFQFPVGILSVSIGNSNLVHFSEAYKTGEVEEAKSYLSSSYFLSFLLIIPVLVVIFIHNFDIVSIVFQRGKFNANDSINTANLLYIYAIGLPFYGIYKIFVPTLYAIDKQRIPVIGSMVSIIFNVIFCLSLVSRYSYPVLALGTTISITINVLILSFYLNRYLNLGIGFFINIRIVRLIVSGIISFSAMRYLISDFVKFGNSLSEKSLELIISTILIFFIYTFLIYLMGEKEVIHKISQRVMSKFKR
jgi:putative peptidoglycan lipid II flippase